MNYELYHHGIEGQKWGVRNGPPYPLSRGSSKTESGKKKRRIRSYLLSRKEKKINRMAEEEEKKKKAAEVEKAKHDADKARVLREGSATEVLQYATEMSAQEFSNAINRIKWTNELKRLAESESEKGWTAINNVMKKVGNVKDWTRTAVDLWKTFDEALQLMDKQKKKDS